MGAQRSLGFYRFLQISWIFRMFQWSLRRKGFRQSIFDGIVKVEPGQRVLDLGCGTGGVLQFLPEVDYVGVDIEPRYIRFANARYKKNCRFICCDFSDLEKWDLGRFDWVILKGVLHHLNDSEAFEILRLARSLLIPGGKLFTLDGVFLKDQSFFAKWLLRLDRGRFVRMPEDYFAIISRAFGSSLVESKLLRNQLKVPYDYYVSICTSDGLEFFDSATVEIDAT